MKPNINSIMSEDSFQGLFVPTVTNPRKLITEQVDKLFSNITDEELTPLHLYKWLQFIEEENPLTDFYYRCRLAEKGIFNQHGERIYIQKTADTYTKQGKALPTIAIRKHNEDVAFLVPFDIFKQHIKNRIKYEFKASVREQLKIKNTS